MRTALTAAGLLLALLFSAWAGAQALAPGRIAIAAGKAPQSADPPVAAGAECLGAGRAACAVRLARLGPPPLEWR